MHNISLPPYTRASERILIYGLYAVLCHAVLISLFCLTREQSAFGYVTPEDFVSLIENTLVSLVAVLIGGCLIDLTAI